MVAAAGGGDPHAWEVLYHRLHPKLQAFFLRRVEAQHVEDMMSETMTRAVGGIDTYQPGDSGFDGWVFGIGRRVAADHHRKNGRIRRQDATAAGMAAAPVNEPEPAEPLVDAEDRAELRRAFVQLPENDRVLLGLRVVSGLSVEQVAMVLGKRPGAVRTAQSRALGRLRRLLEGAR
ncbi:MAG TPA: RNA polymerase sigma factor [Acidimicrobiales bacterium]|nr:RNA polymerase sigma factor [Acidimicrobiales bacterium]